MCAMLRTFLDALRNNGVAAVHTPRDEDLRLGRAEFLRDLLHVGVLREVWLADHCISTRELKRLRATAAEIRTVVAERAVCGYVDVLLFAIGDKLVLREKRMCLNLVRNLRSAESYQVRGRSYCRD